MPRKKKNGQSPARVPGLSNEGSSSNPAGYISYGGEMASNFLPGSALSSSDKENIVSSMQEMFSHLDPEVIYIVLSECDFKVENAMDSLLELSVAAEDAAPLSPGGFERTAAALLSPQCSSSSLDLRQSGLSPSTLLPPPEPNARQDPSELSPSPTSPLTDELDLLIDQELESLATRSGAKEEPTGSQYVSAPASLSSLLLPPPPIPQQRLPEVLPPGHGCGGEAVRGLLDFSHLTSERPASAPHPSLTLGVSGRPSAFQAYKKEYRPGTFPERSTTMSCGGVVGGARSKLSAAAWDPPSGALSPWNPEAPAFVPRSSQGGPAFITPVVPSSLSTWDRHSRPASHWMSQGPVGHAPPRLPAALPKAWSLPTAPQPSRLQLEEKVLVLLRGAPGSGKSTLARAMLEHNPGGVILSTDDYFCQLGEYRFEPTALGEAHEWNHKRAKKAFETGISPIVIDNTNMQGWEMKPYVAQALRHKYKVMFRDPDTWWKHKPRELVKRTKHGVVADRIRRMLDGYEHCVSVQSIMGSQMPEWKQLQQEVNRASQPVSSDTPHPDLVGESRQTKEFDTSGINLFSSLPDVSSIKPSGAIRTPENRGSTEYRPPSGTAHEVLRVPSEGDDTDPGDVVSELDAEREALGPSGGQGFPDCIVESVLSEDRHDDELPVAFSESIAQRVRRERPSRPADLVRNTDQSEREAESSEGVDGGHTQTGRPELLDFVGDWPSEGRLDQRQARQRQRQVERHAEDQGENAKAADRRDRQPKARLASGVAEFQKLLDLIQTYPSVDGAHAGSPAGLPRSPSSPSSDEECGMEGMEVGESQDAHGDQANAGGRGSARADLPDCVQDWKASLSSAVPPSPNANDRETGTTEGRAHMLDGDREKGPLGRESVNVCDSLANLSGDSPVTSESGVADVGHDVADGHVEGAEVCTEVAVGQSEKDMQTRTTQRSLTEDFSEPDGSHSGEVSVSPVCEGSLEAESASLGGGAQDRKRQGRRSGKQCKLALTFTQNCRTSSPKDLKDSPSATAQNQSSSPFSVQSDVDLNSTPESALGLKTNLHLCPDLRDSPSPESKLQPSSPALITDTGYATQTNPEDFALLWRLNAPGVIMGSHPDDITVLSGNPSRFLPEVPHALSAVHLAGHREVPYHVVYEKGTQVEEKELGGASSHLESLRILSCHFKLVSFDTLEDLYDKCQQDLDWTTNLLLDSGERFFREEDVEDESAAWSGDDQNSNVTPGALDQESTSGNSAGRAFKQLGEGYETFPWSSGQMSEEKGDQGLTEWDPGHVGGEMTPEFSQNPVNKSSPQPPQSMLGEMKAERCEDVEKDTTLEPLVPESELPGGTSDDERLSEALKAERGVVEMSCMDEVTQLILAELEEIQRGESVQHKDASIAQRTWEEGRSKHLNIQSVELKLPTELALQLTELFGPVGIDPGACSAEEYEVQMDLSLARLLHQKWKDTIQERQRQAALSYHLLQESSVHWGESQEDISGSREGPAHFLIGADGYASLGGQPETQDDMPFMDHWNVSHHQVSLRDIMTEEQARQENMEKTRQSSADLDRRDGAVLLKEYQLYSLFPTIDRHFLQDIFRDHNYCLQETEQFLRSLLDEGPVKTVVAPELPPSDLRRASSKDREKQRQRPAEPILSTTYQDTEDPEYQDFRAEASLQKARQLECFAKAAEAYRQGRKDVASFYAQQGHLHSDRMHGANQRAAAQIFERVNSSLLPRNILDLHGLHVDEALQHLAQVLLDKTTEYQQGSCQPQLSVITGRGNHSQGGVARIRPAVIDYLANKHYKFTEPKPGLVLVSLC